MLSRDGRSCFIATFSHVRSHLAGCAGDRQWSTAHASIDVRLKADSNNLALARTGTSRGGWDVPCPVYFRQRVAGQQMSVRESVLPETGERRDTLAEVVVHG